VQEYHSVSGQTNLPQEGRVSVARPLRDAAYVHGW
jgi:hypothetical protein